MRSVARGLDHDPRQVNAGGPSAFLTEHAASRMDARQQVGEKMLRGAGDRRGRAEVFAAAPGFFRKRLESALPRVFRFLGPSPFAFSSATSAIALLADDF
jgi:hypothetical protein